MTDEEILTRIAQGEDSRTQFKRGVYMLPLKPKIEYRGSNKTGGYYVACK